METPQENVLNVAFLDGLANLNFSCYQPNLSKSDVLDRLSDSIYMLFDEKCIPRETLTNVTVYSTSWNL